MFVTTWLKRRRLFAPKIHKTSLLGTRYMDSNDITLLTFVITFSSNLKELFRVCAVIGHYANG